MIINSFSTRLLNKFIKIVNRKCVPSMFVLKNKFTFFFLMTIKILASQAYPHSSYCIERLLCVHVQFLFQFTGGSSLSCTVYILQQLQQHLHTGTVCNIGRTLSFSCMKSFLKMILSPQFLPQIEFLMRTDNFPSGLKRTSSCFLLLPPICAELCPPVLLLDWRCFC